MRKPKRERDGWKYEARAGHPRGIAANRFTLLERFKPGKRIATQPRERLPAITLAVREWPPVIRENQENSSCLFLGYARSVC